MRVITSTILLLLAYGIVAYGQEDQDITLQADELLDSLTGTIGEPVQLDEPPTPISRRVQDDFSLNFPDDHLETVSRSLEEGISHMQSMVDSATAQLHAQRQHVKKEVQDIEIGKAAIAEGLAGIKRKQKTIAKLRGRVNKLIRRRAARMLMDQMEKTESLLEEVRKGIPGKNGGVRDIEAKMKAVREQMTALQTAIVALSGEESESSTDYVAAARGALKDAMDKQEEEAKSAISTTVGDTTLQPSQQTSIEDLENDVAADAAIAAEEEGDEELTSGAVAPTLANAEKPAPTAVKPVALLEEGPADMGSASGLSREYVSNYNNLNYY